jgi:pyridoxal phosphate enzyme (YggS family)
MSDPIACALQAVHQRIRQATLQAGRKEEEVQLLAVSKTFPPDAIRAAWQAGQRAFGENYVQEFTDKLDALRDLPLEWHFIGPIQSNKTRVVAENAQWVHSVDRSKIADRLAAQRPASLQPLNVCIQVNVSGEASKSGCTPDELASLAAHIATLERLHLRGLMCIPEPTEDPQRLAAQFLLLQRLRQQLRASGYALDTLSMGMSADLDLAVGAGATLVRVGTAIFGSRHYQ